jgi:beta-phosphoglucomutase
MDALLLDYNGVIVDDEPLHFRAFRDALAEAGIALDDAAYAADYLGLDDRAAFREALRRDGQDVDPEHVARLVRRKATHYATLAERELVIVPGVVEFVLAAARSAFVAVVSGAIRPEIDDGLARAGLDRVIATVVSAEDVAASKPDPAGFRLALRRLASRHPGTAWRACVIEDSLPGLAAARTLGAGCVMLSTSHPAAALSAAGADAVWPTFSGRGSGDLAPHFRPVGVAGG